MREQLLDAYDIRYGILNCLYGAGGQLNLEYGAALARAINDWQIAEWLEPEPRLRASIIVPYEDGDLAAEEIDRVGDHPGFVQVLLLVRTNEPLGRPKYRKIYRAALRHNLPVGIHFGGAGAGPITGAGWPSHYIEDHGGMPQAFQAQIISLVCEGVFEQLPLTEGGPDRRGLCLDGSADVGGWTTAGASCPRRSPRSDSPPRPLYANISGSPPSPWKSLPSHATSGSCWSSSTPMTG